MLGAWMRGVIQLFTETREVQGKGCGSCVRAFVASAEFGQIKWVLSGFVFVIDGADGLGVVVVHDVDLGPVVSSLRISTRLVLLHPLPAFFLLVALDFAKMTVFAVSVIVVSASGVACSSTGSVLVSSSSGVVTSSVCSAGLVGFGSCPSSIEGRHVIGLAFCSWLFFPYFIDQCWTFALELPLGGGRYLVHLLNGDGFLLLLSHHRM